MLPQIAALPRGLSPAAVEAVSEAVREPRGRRYRLAVYVCERHHTLAEVVALPGGPVLLVHGLGALQWRPGQVPETLTAALDPGVRLAQRSRAKGWGIALADLAEFLAAAPDSSPIVEPACRCGRHRLDLSEVGPETSGRMYLRPAGQR